MPKGDLGGDHADYAPGRLRRPCRPLPGQLRRGRPGPNRADRPETACASVLPGQDRLPAFGGRRPSHLSRCPRRRLARPHSRRDLPPGSHRGHRRPGRPQRVCHRPRCLRLSGRLPGSRHLVPGPGRPSPEALRHALRLSLGPQGQRKGRSRRRIVRASPLHSSHPSPTSISPGRGARPFVGRLAPFLILWQSKGRVRRPACPAGYRLRAPSSSS